MFGAHPGELRERRHLASPEAFKSTLGEVSAGLNDEDIERLRHFYVDKWETGEAAMVMPEDWPVLAMIGNLDKGVGALGRLGWRLLVADATAAFIISVTPVAVYDPVMSKADPSWGSGVMSSSHAETSTPLDPQHCLVMSPGYGHWEVVGLPADRACSINLRTYAWAEQWIFGRSRAAVQNVREQAKKRRSEVAELRLRPGNLVVMDIGPGRPPGRQPRRYRLRRRKRGR